MMSKNSEAVGRYQKARDNIMIRPDKETGARIRAAAAAAGKSVQRYILDALEAMEAAEKNRPDNRAE